VARERHAVEVNATGHRLHGATLWAPAADDGGRVGLDGAGEAVPRDEGVERAVGPRGEPAPAALRAPRGG
jgi:hypothetical protein